jgi:hypothetical protein
MKLKSTIAIHKHSRKAYFTNALIQTPTPITPNAKVRAKLQIRRILRGLSTAFDMGAGTIMDGGKRRI